MLPHAFLDILKPSIFAHSQDFSVLFLPPKVKNLYYIYYDENNNVNKNRFCRGKTRFIYTI